MSVDGPWPVVCLMVHNVRLVILLVATATVHCIE